MGRATVDEPHKAGNVEESSVCVCVCVCVDVDVSWVVMQRISRRVSSFAAY